MQIAVSFSAITPVNAEACTQNFPERRGARVESSERPAVRRLSRRRAMGKRVVLACMLALVVAADRIAVAAERAQTPTAPPTEAVLPFPDFHYTGSVGR